MVLGGFVMFWVGVLFCFCLCWDGLGFLLIGVFLGVGGFSIGWGAALFSSFFVFYYIECLMVCWWFGCLVWVLGLLWLFFVCFVLFCFCCGGFVVVIVFDFVLVWLGLGCLLFVCCFLWFVLVGGLVFVSLVFKCFLWVGLVYGVSC